MSDFLKIYTCLNILLPPHILALFSLWSAKLILSDQVPTLWTAWRWWLWRGSWLWRSDWTTAGVCAARAVKCAAGVERGVCRGWSMLARLCLSALSEPFCFCWTCNAVSTHSLLSPYIKCAGCGWGVSTQGCSPSSICYRCELVKPPSRGKTWLSWSHLSPLKRWLYESSPVLRWHCNWCNYRVGNLRLQWRFSDAYLLNPPKCLWSAS